MTTSGLASHATSAWTAHEPSRRILHAPLYITEVKWCTFGGLATVAGGAGNHAEWAWLKGSRVAQSQWTPLHDAAYFGRLAAIQALVEAKADVHAKNDVRGGLLGGRGRRWRRVWILLLLFWSFEPQVL